MKSGNKLLKILWLLPVLLAVPAYFASAALTGQQIYDQNCARCHKLGSYDTSGSRDLLGDGSKVNDKFDGGRSKHKGIRLTSSDITNVAAFLNNPTTTTPLAILTTSFPDATVGTSYGQILTASGGKTPYTWSRSSGTLPSGLSLDSSGVISGILSAAGTFTFTVKVTDSAAASDTKSLSITVAPATPPLSITTSTLPDGTVGSAYSQTLAATGGTSPYTWSSNGMLPTGVTVTSGGVLTGTPTASGTYSFTIIAVDSKSVTASRSLSLTIAAPVSTPMSADDKNLFLANCVACHTPSGLEYRSTSQIQSAIRGNVGGMGTTQLKSLTTANIDGIARSLVPGTPEVISCDTCHSSSPSPTPTTGQAIYDTQCAGCHKLSSYDTSGSAPDLYQSTRIDSYFTPGSSGHKGITLSATDISDLKAFLNNPSSSPTPTPTPTPTTGQGIYDANCAGCHKLGSYDTSGSAPDLYQSTRIDSYFTPGSSGHKGITLSATDISDLKAFLNNPSSSPTPTPTPTPTAGQAKYDSSCASCHRMSTYDTSGSAPDLYQTTRIDSYYTAGVSGHRGITLSATDISDLKTFFGVTTTPAPTPTPTTGQEVYDANCASCHRLGTYDTSGTAPNLSGYGSDVSEKYTPGVSGHRGITLTATELSSLSAFLNSN